MKSLKAGRLASYVALAGLLLGAGIGDSAAQSRVKGQLGTSGVEVEASGNSSRGRTIVVRHDGREFAKYSAPAGTQEVLVCCNFGTCEPIGTNVGLICDIVIWCPFEEACTPQ